MKRLTGVLAGVVLLSAGAAIACAKHQNKHPLPEAAQKHVTAGLEQFHAGNCKDAAASMKQAFEASRAARNDGWAMRVVGVCAFREGNYKEARKQLSHAVDFFALPELREQLGVAEFELGEVKDADKTLSKLAKGGFLTNPRAQLTLARAKLKLNDRAGAVAVVEQSLRQNPQNADLQAMQKELKGS